MFHLSTHRGAWGGRLFNYFHTFRAFYLIFFGKQAGKAKMFIYLSLHLGCAIYNAENRPVCFTVATRPLAIQLNGTWYTYGWDLTKNICELYSSSGTISTSYTYSPFGSVTASGSIAQPIQWSSEVWDCELGLVYYCLFYNKSAFLFLLFTRF